MNANSIEKPLTTTITTTPNLSSGFKRDILPTLVGVDKDINKIEETKGITDPNNSINFITDNDYLTRKINETSKKSSRTNKKQVSNQFLKLSKFDRLDKLDNSSLYEKTNNTLNNEEFNKLKLTQVIDKDKKHESTKDEYLNQGDLIVKFIDEIMKNLENSAKDKVKA